jgi:hypothetical protein
MQGEILRKPQRLNKNGIITSPKTTPDVEDIYI